MGTNGGITTLGQVLESLAHPTRRFILYYLQAHEMATVDELVHEVAAWEMELPPDEVPADHRERVATKLTHTHLPKLADSLFIEYDSRSRTVRYSDPPVLLDTVLGLLAHLEEEFGE